MAADSKHSEASEGYATAPADALSLPFLARCSSSQTADSAGAEVGLLFPGIGVEYVSMLADCQSLPGVKKMLAKAKDILGYDILEICLKGPCSKLVYPRYSYPALFIAGLAGLEKFHRENEELAGSFGAATGLGVGEYTALCAAGVVSFEDGLRLVKLAGELTEPDAASCNQGFVVITGLEKPALRNLCVHAARKEGGDALCELVLDLCPSCYGCAGTAKAVTALAELARSAGAFHVKIAKHLDPLACALHTRLAKSRQETMAKAWKEVLPRMSPPKCNFYPILTGVPMGPDTTTAEIVRLVIELWTRPASWDNVFRNMVRDGVTQFFELGPGTQCKEVMAQTDRRAWRTMRNVQV